ncbi:hypothetical protein ACN28S_20715 [Cystobacter fuscus]
MRSSATVAPSCSRRCRRGGMSWGVSTSNTSMALRTGPASASNSSAIFFSRTANISPRRATRSLSCSSST